MRQHSFLDYGPRLVGIVKLCKIARLEINYTELQKQSNIRYKKSFLNYLDFCKEKELIEKLLIKNTPTWNSKKFPYYRTTDKGHQFLESLGEN